MSLSNGLGDDPTAAHNPPPGCLFAERVRGTLGVEHDEVGPCARDESIVGQPQDPCGVLADHAHDCGNLGGRPELGCMGDDQRDLQRVSRSPNG